MIPISDGVVLKHKNVSSIEEYNIGDRLKYSRIKQSSKKDIEESRINVKYQEHYRSIWNSAKCKMQSAKYNVQSAKYKVQSAKCKVQYRNFWNNAKYQKGEQNCKVRVLLERKPSSGIFHCIVLVYFAPS